MVRKISKYIKYTVEELENFKNAEGSLNDFKNSLLTLLSSIKVGLYDENLQGIILDIQNVKLIGTSGAIRFDDPRIHVDIVSDCYIFKPTIGAIVRGTVRHISSSQIGVIIYRVFSVSIRLVNKSNIKLEVNTEIEFKIKQFDLESIYPYIEGELLNNIKAENNLKHLKLEIEEPEDLKNVIELIEEIKEDELNESKSGSPSKAKKRKKGISFKTEE